MNKFGCRTLTKWEIAEIAHTITPIERVRKSPLYDKTTITAADDRTFVPSRRESSNKPIGGQ